MRKKFKLGPSFPKVSSLNVDTNVFSSPIFELVVLLCASFYSDEEKGLKVLRYGNEDSKKSLMYFGNGSSVEEREDEAHPLIATVILYLSNVNRGGQILFPSSEVREQTLSLKN